MYRRDICGMLQESAILYFVLPIMSLGKWASELNWRWPWEYCHRHDFFSQLHLGNLRHETFLSTAFGRKKICQFPEMFDKVQLPPPTPKKRQPSNYSFAVRSYWWVLNMFQVAWPIYMEWYWGLRETSSILGHWSSVFSDLTCKLMKLKDISIT